jgi:hypothetical protein
MERGLVLNVVVRESATVCELLAGENGRSGGLIFALPFSEIELNSTHWMIVDQALSIDCDLWCWRSLHSNRQQV